MKSLFMLVGCLLLTSFAFADCTGPYFKIASWDVEPDFNPAPGAMIIGEWNMVTGNFEVGGTGPDFFTPESYELFSRGGWNSLVPYDLTLLLSRTHKDRDGFWYQTQDTAIDFSVPNESIYFSDLVPIDEVVLKFAKDPFYDWKHTVVTPEPSTLTLLLITASLLLGSLLAKRRVA